MDPIERKETSVTALYNHPILLTKLNVPHQPTYLVTRDRLFTAMSRTLQCKLTLVTAPPGFGKSTMVSDWIRRRNIRAGWISLETGENDLIRFWGYVIAAFERLQKGIGKKALSLLQSPVAFSIEQMVAWLVNDLFDMEEDFVLILDDFHVLESDDVQRSLHYFLERLPNRIHVCILSRKEPAFPIGALRAKGELNQIGIVEMKFTPSEISAFWYEQTGESADETSLRLLAHRTEGWAAGIQLAALSRNSGQPDTLRQFTGNHRYVTDYLMEEVFQRQPETYRKFLMQTSILGRMNREICHAVTGFAAEMEMLHSLERAGLFLIPLDGERYWYRYHHLFAEFLRSRLVQECPADVAGLHLKASEWFELHGFMEEAIDHAFAGGDDAKAADLLENIAFELLRRWELSTLNQWLHRLQLTMEERPNLLFILTWTELFMGHYDRVKVKLSKMKSTLASFPVTDKAILDKLWSETVIIENFLALLQGDFNHAFALLEMLYANDNLPDGEELLLTLGIELNEGTVPFVRGYYGFRGRMKLADRYHQLYNAFIEKNGLYQYAYSAYQRTAMSEIFYERNDLQQAMHYAEQANQVARQLGVMGAYVSSAVVKSRIYWALGETAAAFRTVREAMDYLERSDQRETQWHEFLRAYQVQCQLAAGETVPVDRWLEQGKPDPDAEITINQEFEWLTWIRVLTAKDCLQEALQLATRMFSSAKQIGRVMTVLEAGICLAVVYDRMSQIYDSMRYLHMALELGEKEGYCRTFTDSPGLTPLLMKYAEFRKNGYMPELQSSVSLQYVKAVLSVASESQDKAAASDLGGGYDAVARYEALTPREVEVLQLIAEGLSNKEIAERLVLTEGTVKLHLHRIYGKLQAKGRVQAIQIARQNRLIP
ncbi:LuxR C-terminal-related transcriptional regulator [Paenibacillus andongensis]|uniref:LuxR C-terminal-related transcriptional regulator n=1 Tax=Paenibacillus andongensis TaxID=2975482 RepID=UPI0025B70C43|nr:LuxR C-terminal-related transcriptional regulator [Paenibacillus andongensis]